MAKKGLSKMPSAQNGTTKPGNRPPKQGGQTKPGGKPVKR